MTKTLNLSALPVGTQLMLRRMALGLRQRDVAEKLGVQVPRITEAEKGRGHGRRAGAIPAMQERIDALLTERESTR